MRMIHDENIYEETTKTPEEVKNLKDTGMEGKGTDASRPMPGILLCILPVLAIILMVCLIPSLGKKGETDAKARSGQPAEEVVFVTEANRPEHDTDAPPAETDAQAGQGQEENLPETEDLSWQEAIFGSSSKSVITAPMSVTGLTENEKNLTRFRESDFIRSLSAFLVANNIHVSGVTFTGPIACSAGDAAGYAASLNGITDRKLIVLFFPKYPGKYLFALETVEKKENPTRQTQAETQAATTQQVPAADTSAAASQPKNDYDAMNLTVKKIPGELANYLSNPYELQYALYDYLYGEGYKGIRTASVTDYSIDSEERSASIALSVEGAGKVTCSYSLDHNSYSFQ